MTRPRHSRPTITRCVWCDCEFSPKSYRNKLCSDGCAAAYGNRKLIHTFGPCPTCGEHFKSRIKKTYCSMKCYTGSSQFKEHTISNLKEINTNHGIPKTCLQCGADYPRSKRSKFCAKLCRRKYYADRFDRWIANPESVALPQNYDEFLARDVLTCPVSGCTWEGENLSNHVNFTHGITAQEFKRLCGFNLKTGLVGQDLSQALTDRNHRLRDAGILKTGFDIRNADRSNKDGLRYVSLEAKEHYHKSMADRPITRDVFINCRECGKLVQQPFIGKQLYCSIDCRSAYYSKVRVGVGKCSYCGSEFEGTKDQARRYKRGLPVACSVDCRNKMNIANALAARGIHWETKGDGK